MIDLLLDDTTHDLVTKAGDLVLADKALQIRQNVKQNLLFFLGEWFLNIKQGLPYFQFIFVKGPNLDLIQVIFRNSILGTTGILELNQFELSYAAGTRELNIEFDARSTDGQIVVNVPVGV